MKASKFLQTTLLGGLAAILPLGLLVLFFRWVIVLIEKYLKPLVNIVEHNSRASILITYLIAVVAIILFFLSFGAHYSNNAW
jgi:uncharacterized membrane protein